MQYLGVFSCTDTDHKIITTFLDSMHVCEMRGGRRILLAKRGDRDSIHSIIFNLFLLNPCINTRDGNYKKGKFENVVYHGTYV